MKFGLHVSIAGKIYLAVERAHEMNCDCFQTFVGNPRAWRDIGYPAEDVKKFRELQKELGVAPYIIHAMYLINMATPKPDLHKKSTDTLCQTVRMGEELGARTVVVHIGSHSRSGVESGIKQIAAAIKVAAKECKNTTISLEPSAGGGDHIGSRFEQLRQIFEGLKWDKRITVCLDTAHLWAAGYDVADPKAFDQMIKDFDSIIGLERLSCLHLNDSKALLDSHVDRHDNIGDGKLGLATFKHIIHHPKLKDLPAIMETPGYEAPGSNGKNIETIKSLL